jgi:hypothetical protein
MRLNVSTFPVLPPTWFPAHPKTSKSPFHHLASSAPFQASVLQLNPSIHSPRTDWLATISDVLYSVVVWDDSLLAKDRFLSLLLDNICVRWISLASNLPVCSQTKDSSKLADATICFIIEFLCFRVAQAYLWHGVKRFASELCLLISFSCFMDKYSWMA